MEKGTEEGLKLLENFKPEIALKLLHSIVDGILHRGRPLYQEYSESVSLQEWWEMTDACEALIMKAVGDSWTKDLVQANLESLPGSISTSLSDVISTRRDEVQEQLVANTNSISQAKLTDFDWEVKLVMSSDRIASVQEPLVTLDLDVTSQKDKKIHSLELDRNDLKKLINSLEGANKVVQQWKT